MSVAFTVAGETETIDRGDVWSYVSPSRLNLWLKCPLAFRLRYIDGVRSPTTAAQFVGKRLHAALEHYYRHRQLNVELAAEDILARLHATWDQAVLEDAVCFANSAEETACRQQAAAIVAAYLAQVTSTESKPLAVERSLEAPLVDPSTGEDLGIPLVGILDLVLDDPIGPTIVDFKTAARGGQLAETMHEVQLSSYAYLFRHAAGRAESALEIRSLVKTKIPKVETHAYPPRTVCHLQRLFAVIRAYLDDLDRDRFVFRPSLMCSSCEFHTAHCRTWTG